MVEKVKRRPVLVML